MPPNAGEALAIIQNHVNFDAPGPRQDAADWESLPELPTPDEILNPDASTEDLPWFPVKHRWESKEEYLASLYKILRFEGIEGLRYSVNSFKLAPNMNDDKNTCVYTKVRVKGYLFSRLGPMARVSFSTYRAGARIKWKQSQRLMPGKIVALSTDNFQTDCRVAVIAQRPFEGGLDQNPPLIDITWADPDQAVINPDQSLVMVESRNGYYESVRHALRGLQHAMREWSPIDKYTVSLDHRDLKCSSVPDNFDLSAIISHLPAEKLEESNGDQRIQQAMFRELTNRFQQCSLAEFHTIKPYTSLDDSQLEALERMVCKELAIIQGPPGTGKTHTSIQSLKTILKNRKPGDPPIVVAAQTNHALDQLLLYCRAYNINIMRVGSRTDNQEIMERTVYELRRTAGKIPGNGKHRAVENERKNIVRQFETLVNEVFGEEGFLNSATLLASGIITEAQYSSLEDDDWVSGEDKSSMEVWLGEEIIERNRQLVDELDFAEVEAVDEIFELDANLDDDQPADDDDDRIYGEFISLSSQLTGMTPKVPHWEERCRAMLDNERLFDVPRGYRGGVYQILQSKLLDASAGQLRDMIKKATKQGEKRKVVKWADDLHVVDKHRIDVVGCTTTGLTKYRGFLSALQPRILLIEEAAETREANIVSALFPCLQQLILVGDHQQLPPSCDIARLGTDPYNLNVSLFERLVVNKLPYTMLNQQRRMAPELRYIVQQFYPKLKDHPLVTEIDKRPLIPGMGHRRSWFFNHQWPEDTDTDNSKFNLEEVEMIVSFIIYLLRNGVDASEITVLTYYKGQRRKILQRLRGDDVPIGSFFKVVTVDSYQGEENEIVLLSVVRSPQMGREYNVGFVESRNRATVAISRARRGFYVFGNKMNLLSACNESLTTWGPVWNGFARQKRVLTPKGLPLVCQNHKNEIWVKEANDLVNNAGGCGVRCGETRSCGHACALPCHYWPHEKLPCRVPCTTKLACGHKCGGVCSDPCSCSQNCPEATRSQMQLHISNLALTSDPDSQELNSEASSDAKVNLHGAYGVQSRQSSPEKWQRFSHNPNIHDDAVREAILQGDMQAGGRTPSPLDIKETFVPVSTGNGHRLAAATHATSRFPQKDARSDQMQSTFGRTAIGYSEQQTPNTYWQQHAQIAKRQQSATLKNGAVNAPGARSIRSSQEHTRMDDNQVYLNTSGPHTVVPADQAFAGYENGSTTSALGFEAEVLGQRPTPIPAPAGRRAQVLACHNTGPLIDFASDTGDMTPILPALDGNARIKPASKNIELDDIEEPCLITF